MSLAPLTEPIPHTIGIVFNTTRIALLVVLSADHAFFNYWHTGEGSSLFSLGAAGVLATVSCFLAIRNSQDALENGPY